MLLAGTTLTSPSPAQGASVGISVDASTMLKSYPAAPPLTASYLPDNTTSSAEFAPTAERHGADLDTIVLSQQAYQTAHPSDAPCGDPSSDCGEGANNAGVPEYDWTSEIDPEINFLTHANRAPSAYTFLILKTPSFLQSSPGNNISYPTNLTAWANIASDMWHHLWLKAPAWVSKTYLEIWNEPDGKGISLSQYESLYAAAAKAIKTTAAAFGSTALVGAIPEPSSTRAGSKAGSRTPRITPISTS
jgi:hypothetical protein